MSVRDFTAEELDQAFERAKYLTLPSHPQPEGYAPEDVAKAVAHRYGVSLSEVRERGKFLHVAAARRAVAIALRDRGWSYPAIGRFLLRDQSTARNLVLGRPQ